ncbi:MAG: O-antigen ligase family protein [Vicinamibacteria bacterium]
MVPAQRIALSTLLTVTLFAFGGIYPTATPWVLGGAILAWLAGGGPSARVTHGARDLQIALAALVAALALQLLPLPAPLRAVLSPAAGPLEAALRPDALFRQPGWAPLSVVPSATAHALALVIATALTYRSALTVFAQGGVRQVSRVLAAAGAVVAVVAMAQRAVAPGLIYGIWRPEDAGAQPFGPVVNRNHLAAWLIMAGSLALGYMVARLRTRMDGPVLGAPWRLVIRRVFDSGVMTLAGAWAVMATAISVSRSRSGLIALAVSLLVLWRGGERRRWHPRETAIIGLLLACGLALALALGDAAALAGRFLSSFDGSDTGRPVIWRETLPLAGDFWLTGTGAGTFSTAMVAYQQSHPVAAHLEGRVVHFNHAHNHYLHVAAEGGLLLALPVLAVLWAFLRLARRRLREERGEMLWIRLGAFAGLVGVAVQSLWEVPLTMPANALLAATLAAIVTCKRNGR